MPRSEVSSFHISIRRIGTATSVTCVRGAIWPGVAVLRSRRHQGEQLEPIQTPFCRLRVALFSEIPAILRAAQHKCEHLVRKNWDPRRADLLQLPTVQRLTSQPAKSAPTKRKKPRAPARFVRVNPRTEQQNHSPTHLLTYSPTRLPAPTERGRPDGPSIRASPRDKRQPWRDSCLQVSFNSVST
jgi:hypothetical protein